MLVNPGDNVLLDSPTYSGTLAAVSECSEHNDMRADICFSASLSFFQPKRVNSRETFKPFSLM